MQLRNIPRNFPKYTRRAHYFRSNSSPFLSGDLFADESDVQVYSPRFRSFQPSRREVSAARVIFCPGHQLERFLDDYSNQINARVLILGNSDRDYPNFEHKLPFSIRTVFAQNCYRPREQVRILPIGIENLRLATNGMRHLFGDNYSETHKTKNLLIGPFSRTHSERDVLIHSAEIYSEIATVLADRINPSDYALIASQHKFIATPRGNGLDTHRFWEALYRGSSPIVMRSNWAQTLLESGLPVLQVDDWSKDTLETASKTVFQPFNPKALPILWWNYWRDEIHRSL